MTDDTWRVIHKSVVVPTHKVYAIGVDAMKHQVIAAEAVAFVQIQEWMLRC